MSRVAERRAARLADLKEMEELWRQSRSLCAQLHASSPNRPGSFAIRSSFFFAEPGDEREPPIVRLAAPRGVNLQLYLLILFEAQCRKRTGYAGPSPLPLNSRPEDLSWTSLTYSKARQTATISARANRERQVRSALKRLEEEQLVQRNVGTPPRAVTPLDESGRRRKEAAYYRMPDPFENVIWIPSTFVTQGWLYLLTPSEIRFYLAFRHLEVRYLRRQGAFFSHEARAFEYFLSRDVYESHLMLHRLGLVRRVDDPRRRSDGKLLDFIAYAENGEKWPLHHFRRGEDEAGLLKRPAYEVIRRALINPSTGVPRPRPETTVPLFQ